MKTMICDEFRLKIMLITYYFKYNDVGKYGVIFLVFRYQKVVTSDKFNIEILVTSHQPVISLYFNI